MGSGTSYLDAVRQVPITDFAGRIGFHLVVKSSRYLSLREHDSVIIDVTKNAFWRNSTGASGGVIDFAIEFCGCASAKEAIREIASMYGIEHDKSYIPNYRNAYASAEPVRPSRSKGDIKLPERAESNKAAWCYLQHTRCIEKSVLYYFKSHKMFYQDTRNNCVFHTGRFACIRSTGAKRFAIDVEGCDYDECFFFKGNSDAETLYVCESVIDIMSVMSVMVKENVRYSENAYLALSGVTKADSIYYHLDHEPKLNRVFLCFDNDDAGKKAADGVLEHMKQAYPHVSAEIYPSPEGKDWNEYLQITHRKEISEYNP